MCVSSSFFFIAVYYHIVRKQYNSNPFSCLWTLRVFHVLGNYANADMNILYLSFGGHMYSFLLSKCLGVALLGYRTAIHLAPLGTACFPKWFKVFTFLPSTYVNSSCSKYSLTLDTVSLSNYIHSFMCMCLCRVVPLGLDFHFLDK